MDKLNFTVPKHRCRPKDHDGSDVGSAKQAIDDLVKQISSLED